MRRALVPLLTLLVAFALLPACAEQADPDDVGLSAGGEVDPSGDLDEEIDEPIAPDTGLDGEEAPTADQVVEAALTDVEGFWQRAYEDVYGTPYQPITGGFWAYGPDSEPPPCGTPPPSYGDIADNAFYCPSDDLIAWDDVNLIPQLYDEFGGFTLGIVFAHEFGHAIQARAGTSAPTVVLEMQADCFAGAWTADVEAGNSDFFELTLDDLDKAVAGFLELRDGVGTAADNPAAHGTGFDRIGSFVDGYENGVEYCATYPDQLASGDFVVVEVPFSDPEDFERGGNLPLDELLPSLLEDLENFWTTRFAAEGQTWTPVTDVIQVDPDRDEVECGDDTYGGKVLLNAAFYCVASDTIYIDGVHLIPTLDEIGDYAVATEIARQYAFAAQERMGVDESSLDTNLNADCLAGVYAQSGFLGDRQDQGQSLYLSPGDLDEAVIAFLLRSDKTDEVESDDDVSVGTAFQRFDAYREGFLSGPGACDALLDS